MAKKTKSATPAKGNRSAKVPAYKRHPNGQAYIYHRSIDRPGHVLYLGLFNSEKSLRRYQAFLEQLSTSATPSAAAFAVEPPPSSPSPDLSSAFAPQGLLTLSFDSTLAELAAAFLHHCDGYYRDAAGQRTSEFCCMATAIGPLVELFGDDPARSFGVRNFETYRNWLIAAGYARSTINKHSSRVRGMFRWATKRGHLPPTIWQSLAAIEGLKRGRTLAREPAPVPSVDWVSVAAALPYFSPVVAAMVEVQFWCGMRPQDVCGLRRCDLDMAGKVWLYRPPRHKNAWRGHDLIKAVPQCVQKLLMERFQPSADAYLFSPRESVAWRRGEGSVAAGIGDRYSTDTYRRAVAYGLAKLNAARTKEALANGTPPGDQPALQNWTPMQLRHGIATYLEQTLGRQAAQKYLGHRHLSTTGLYVERDAAELVQIAREIDARARAEIAG